MNPIKFKVLKQTNPQLNLDKIAILKALYEGGSRLLGDDEILSKVLTRYTYERDSVYSERKRRAYYENIFAQVVNHVSAGLAQDPVTFCDTNEDYWTDFSKNVLPVGETKLSFDQCMRDVCVEALVCGWSWIQADLPSVPTEPTSLLEQESIGGLRAYLIPWATECVTDWEVREDRLVWVKTHEVVSPNIDPDSERDSINHVWTIWDSVSWTRYELLKKQSESFPSDDTLIPPVQSGLHSFGRVPWIMLNLRTGIGVHLHLGEHIESLCRSYFNRQNGEAYQWIQNYYQQLYEFLAPEVAGIDTPISDAQSDPARAMRRRAPGEVQVRGHLDSARFVGPNMGGASEGRAATQDQRDAIYRVTAQMALSQDTSGAMLRRSADSKRQDSLQQEIVLGAIGKRVLSVAESAIELLALGRGDAEAPKIRGYENFSVFTVDEVLNRASVVATIDVPSATYKIEHLYQLAITDLGDISDEMKAQIRKELETAITQDQFMKNEDEEDEDEEDEDEDEEDDEDEDEEDEDFWEKE